MQPPLRQVGGGILGSKNFIVTQTDMQELMASGDPMYSFTLIDSSGNSRPLNLVDGVATAPTEEESIRFMPLFRNMERHIILTGCRSSSRSQIHIGFTSEIPRH